MLVGAAETLTDGELEGVAEGVGEGLAVGVGVGVADTEAAT